ncbi:MAG: hypothetical protein K8M05_26565, partial [Deltaproteobacteria bacterium]|nr:hypothetical protein [Kofleriaceae bacterium]
MPATIQSFDRSPPSFSSAARACLRAFSPLDMQRGYQTRGGKSEDEVLGAVAAHADAVEERGMAAADAGEDPAAIERRRRARG